jgi:hypothetical protein
MRWLVTLSTILNLSLLAQNVGIGTTSPTHRLHLANISASDQGLLRVQSLSNPNKSVGTFSDQGVLGKVNFTGDPKDLLHGDLTFKQDATDWRLVGNTGTNASTNFLGTTDNQLLVFRTNNTECMRILSDGLVWINTTSALSPSNSVVNILSLTGASDRALTARSDTIGIYGEVTGGLGPGVAGVYSSTATEGIGFFARGNGLTSFPTNINPVGFVAQGTIRGLMGVATSTTTTPRMGGYFTNSDATRYSRVACRDGTTNYKILGTGTVNTVIQDGQGRCYLLTAPEAPEFLFQDFGEGELRDGEAFVQIEPKLIEHIEMGRLQVWLTPLGPCEGLYPELALEKGGFYVRERGGGRSQVRFMWAWSAPVKGWGRFPAVSPPPTVGVTREAE